MGFKVIESPLWADAPIDSYELKRHLHISQTNSGFDPELENICRAVSNWVAGEHGWLERSIVCETLEITVDAFPVGSVRLRRPPA